MRWVAVARTWWPVPTVVVTSVILQKVLLESRYDVGGHAAGHLASATAPFAAGAVVVILVWATPLARRQAAVLVGAGAWFAATVVVMVGNLRVVDDLVRTGFANAPTQRLPDTADHSLANLALWLVVATAVANAAIMWRRGHVSTRVGIGAAIVSVLFPPWIIPGAGMPLLAIARCLAMAKSTRQQTDA